MLDLHAGTEIKIVWTCRQAWQVQLACPFRSENGRETEYTLFQGLIGRKHHQTAATRFDCCRCRCRCLPVVTHIRGQTLDRHRAAKMLCCWTILSWAMGAVLCAFISLLPQNQKQTVVRQPHGEVVRCRETYKYTRRKL